MNILLITSSYPHTAGDPSGHFVREEAERLRAEGHRVRIACPRTPLPEEAVHVPKHLTLGGKELFGLGGAWPRLKESPFRALYLLTSSGKAFAAALSPADRYWPDKIIAHWLFPGAVPWGLFFYRRSIPFQIVVHGTDQQLLLQCPTWMRKLLLEGLRKAKVELRFVSRALKNQLKNAHFPASLNDWIDSAEVRAPALGLEPMPDRESLRAQLGLNLEERALLVVGRLIPSKRPQVALRAALMIPDARIYVAGDGPLRAQLEREFPEVSFLGQLPRPEVLRWIASVDLLISASRLEGAPTTIREALALGTTVVSVEAADLVRWAEKEHRLWCLRRVDS